MKNIVKKNAEELFSAVAEELEPYNIVLDIGCGIRPQTMAKANTHICMDAHNQYLEHIKENTIAPQPLVEKFKYVLLNRTTDFLLSAFPRKSVDTVFFLDVIEHLDKEYGKKVIKAFEEIAKHKIVIFTPLGFVEQAHPDGKDAWGLDSGKWQEHKSGWTPDDFDDSWKFFVCDDFHTASNVGEIHQTPVGAFFAVKDVSNLNGSIWNRHRRVQQIVRLLNYLRFNALKWK